MKETSDYRNSHTAPEKGKQYDNRFRNYEWRKYLWKHEQFALDSILNNYYAARSISYLDFACGTGRIIEFMSKRIDDCTGVDISESMLNECRSKLLNHKIIQADITRYDVLGDRKFNLITAFRFFPNAQDSLRRKAIKTLSMHLDRDGLLVFNNHRNTSSALFTLGRMIKNDLKTMSNGEVDDLVESAGLEIIDYFSIGVLPGYDNKPMIVPESIHRLADCFVKLLKLGRVFCQDIIFVCRKSGEIK